ncbi:ComEC/Rec2 family competence protein [Nocardioides solisilvae]|uniref:ComEC/Rec2 family competence protein n=1 Tax=Nocardioides solisilvae TaxID=1542435 RepID=UPI001EF59189|nr:ComEC/Rec2 family competence protein [Nocardioides solisilvae]
MAAWAGGLVGLRATDAGVAAGIALLAVLLVASLRAPGARPTRTAAVLVAAAVLVSAWARAEQTGTGPVPELAGERATVDVVLQVTSDPRPLAGAYGEQVVVRGTVRHVAGRGGAWQVRSPVVVLGGPGWRPVRLGSTVRTRGRLLPGDGDASALLRPTGAGPALVEGPDAWWRGAAAVRAGLRTAVATRPEDQRVLVPSLVVGDDAGLDPGLAADFRTTGLTHLLAVSGTNLTLMVGFLLLAGRWLGVRGRGRYVVGVLGIVGFVLLARTEPSVVRAAAMGSIALLAFTSNGRDRGIRTLGAAVVALLLWDPRLAVSVGFALSVLATAGILLLAPQWRDAARRWLPRGVAEAVAVPAAAQLACTPVVAAISGEVSLVAVLANLLVAPAVAPATVLGLVGGVCAVGWPALGQLVALPAGWAAGWIIAVARWGAALPTPAVDWGTGPWALAGLTVLCGLLAVAAPRVLRRPVATTLLCVAGLAVVVIRPPSPGWPASGWVLAACDVGQGDALAVRVAPGAAIVVDAGPEPAAVDRCLSRLGVEEVPLLVLTHFHADHVGGLDGVLGGRAVGEVRVSPLADPADGAREVLGRLARDGLVPGHGPGDGAPVRVGEATVQQLWPPADGAGPAAPGGANDASLVLLVEVRGVRALLTGDVEPGAQGRLARLLPPGLTVDVLKVPHHGSPHQDERLLASLRPRVALVPVGADNTYGHPAPAVVALLEGVGARVLRTDTSGDVLVLERDGVLHTAARR